MNKLKKSDRIVRTYRVEQCANTDKLDKVLAVLQSYRKTADSISDFQWQLFYKTGNFYKDEVINNGIVESEMSERWKQTCQYQVVSMLDCYIENCKNRFVDIVKDSTIDKETRLQLYYINKYQLWHKSEVQMPKFVDNKKVKDEYIDVNVDVIKLARKIMNHILNGRRKPSMKNINMTLDAKVAQIILKEPDKASKFDWWIKLSTLISGKPVFIPIQSNNYFDSKDGKILNSCQFNFDRNNNLDIYFIKESLKPDYHSDVDKIAFDIGLNTFIATNFGDLFGRLLYDKLKHWDNRLVELAVKQQKQGQSVDTRQHRQIVKTIRALIKNEIGRIINCILDVYHPKEIVMEELDFSDSRLSKQTNRILRNFGKGVLTKKLESISQLYDIKITEVNPAYTSKECVVCGFIDQRSRKGEEFKCKFCGHVGNADVDGAKSVLVRSSDKEISVYQGQYKVLNILVGRFCQMLSDSRYASIVRAVEVLRGNKYMTVYKKYLQLCPEGFL